MERGEVASAAAQQCQKDEKEEQSLVFLRTMLMAAVGREADMRAEIERLRAEMLRLQIVSRDAPIPCDEYGWGVLTPPFSRFLESVSPSWEPSIAWCDALGYYRIY